MLENILREVKPHLKEKITVGMFATNHVSTNHKKSYEIVYNLLLFFGYFSLVVVYDQN